MGDVVDLAGHSNAQPERSIGTEYAAQVAPDIIDKFTELGLDPRFVPIVGQHLLDLTLVSCRDIASSTLTVKKVLEPGGRRSLWQRQAVISIPQVRAYEHVLVDGLKGSRIDDSTAPQYAEVVSLNGGVIDDGKGLELLARELAVDWAFYELSADALANGVYMQKKYGRYIRDFNGQASSYEAGLEISRTYLKTVMEPYEVQTATAREDHIALRAGVALELLTDDLLRKGVVSTSGEALGVKQEITESYPVSAARREERSGVSRDIVPHTTHEIIKRLSHLIPREEQQQRSSSLAAKVIEFVRP